MSRFSEEFLREICSSNVVGNFSPFKTGNIRQVEKYIKRILAKINSENQVLVNPDIDDYGSGFASYVDVKISKKDKSDTEITKGGGVQIERTKALSIYISKLCPYWFLGASEWTANFDGSKYIGGSSSFLRPESVSSIDKNLWQNEIRNIEQTFQEFGYNLLTEEETKQTLWFNVDIPTILADKPYQVFDCFFYWED